MPKRNLDHAEPYDSPLYSSQIKLDNDGGNDLVYIGRAGPSAKSSEPYWQIRKLLYSAGVLIQVSFAGNNNTATFIWDNRASYSYDPDS